MAANAARRGSSLAAAAAAAARWRAPAVASSQVRRAALGPSQARARTPQLPSPRCPLSSINGARQGSTWSAVRRAPRDPILGITEAFKEDSDPRKVNLGVGSYRDDDGNPYVFNCVRKAELMMLEQNLDKEYCPISGIPEFTKQAALLAYGKDSPVLEGKRLAIVQSISGTGALRVAGEFIQRHYPKEHLRVLGKRIYLPVPTWGNHKAIFRNSELEVHHYRYCDLETIDLDFAGMYEDIAMAPNHSIVLLHACAHNPTGIEPTPEQWKSISDIIMSRKHFVLFDMAYQGFASGDFDRDAAILRQFVADGHRVGLCQSFAKNMGLYGERVGALSFVCSNGFEALAVESQLKVTIRSMYSSPPIHGARVAALVMASPELRHEWFIEVKAVCSRIVSMREHLRQHLVDLVPARNWDHITRQIGMFCYTGLDPDQCRLLTNEHSVYLTEDGRISMTGINRHNVRYVAEAITQVIAAEKSGQELGELDGEDRYDETIQPTRRRRTR